MAIKRKTINIKKVKLIKPSYTKPTPQKILSFFTEPVRIPVEEIKVKTEVGGIWIGEIVQILYQRFRTIDFCTNLLVERQ